MSSSFNFVQSAPQDLPDFIELVSASPQPASLSSSFSSSKREKQRKRRKILKQCPSCHRYKVHTKCCRLKVSQKHGVSDWCNNHYSKWTLISYKTWNVTLWNVENICGMDNSVCVDSILFDLFHCLHLTFYWNIVNFTLRRGFYHTSGVSVCMTIILTYVQL